MKLPKSLRRRPPAVEVRFVHALGPVHAAGPAVPVRSAAEEVLELLRENASLCQQNEQLYRERLLTEPELIRQVRAAAEQDRRNVVALSDALALAEGRRLGAPLGDDELAGKLLAEVRATVAGVLGLDLGRAR